MTKKTYIITGSSSYLGQAFVDYFSKLDRTDFKVFLTSRSEISIPRRIKEDKRFYYLPGIDLTNEKDINLLFKDFESRINSPFDIINCIGNFIGFKPIEDYSHQEIRDSLDSNLITVINTANIFLPLMKKNGEGNFITFTMNTAYQNYPLLSLFTATKSALDSFITSMANEIGNFNLSAVSFALSTLKTPKERIFKPLGDQENWLEPAEVCNHVYNFLQTNDNLLNGNVFRLYKHSDRFFKDSYYNRIKRK